MARGRSTFKQQDVTRALRCAAKAGIDVGRFEIAKDGRIVVVAISKMLGGTPQNDLDSELSEFEARHGKG